MAGKKYRGTGKVASADFRNVAWKGLTKSGSAITITLENAVNLGNIDWTFAEKGETVAQVVLTATYDNTDAMATDTTEPWTVEIDNVPTSASGEIIVGAGIFYINDVAVALTRGGGSFNVARTFRNINADGDRGPVKDRIAMDESVASFTMNTLQILAKVDSLYSAVEVVN